MAAADPGQAAANKAAEKAAKAAAQRDKAAAKGKGKKAADSPSGNSNMWGPFEAPSDEEGVDPEALVKSKVCLSLTRALLLHCSVVCSESNESHLAPHLRTVSLVD